jgi:2-amino-4-hydroxy-6-hydroxymethyldihydropteridine diphosphokinase
MLNKESISGRPVVGYLGLGSNMNDPENQIETALKAISSLPGTTLLRTSPLYGSKPWGKTDQPDFVNIVAEISTNLDPDSLLRHAKHIEAEQGRTAGERWGPRPVDIDILLYGEERLQSDSLTIPHTRMWERRFVLQPLADLRPDLISPDGITIDKLLGRGDIASQGLWLISDRGKTGHEEK